MMYNVAMEIANKMPIASHSSWIVIIMFRLQFLWTESKCILYTCDV